MENKDLVLKVKLHGLCVEQVTQRISSAKEAMDTIQSAANQETKSSAGDKYETGRAMMQLEQEKNARQLMEAMKIKKVLDELDATKECREVQHGTLLFTNQGNFFLCVGIGKLDLEGEEYMIISPVSPLARQLAGLRSGQEITFNGRNFKILKLV